MFGSAVRNFKSARDVDLALEDRHLDSRSVARLTSTLESLFGKEVDLVFLNSKLNPTLVHEISAGGTNLWEKPRTGRTSYIRVMEPLLALAEDLRSGYPLTDRTADILRSIKRLDAGNETRKSSVKCLLK